MQPGQDKCPDIAWSAEPWQPFPQDWWDEETALWGWPKALSGSKLNKSRQQAEQKPAARAQVSYVSRGLAWRGRGGDGLSPFAQHSVVNIWVLHTVLGPCSTGKTLID